MRIFCILYIVIFFCTAHSYQERQRELIGDLQDQMNRNKRMQKKLKGVVSAQCSSVPKSDKNMGALSFAQFENEQALDNAQQVLKSSKGGDSALKSTLNKLSADFVATIKDKSVAQGVVRHVKSVRSCCDYRLKQKLYFCKGKKRKNLLLFMEENLFRQTCHQGENSGRLSGGVFHNTQTLCSQLAKSQMVGKCKQHLSRLMGAIQGWKEQRLAPINQSYKDLQASHRELEAHLKEINSGYCKKTSASSSVKRARRRGNPQ